MTPKPDTIESYDPDRDSSFSIGSQYWGEAWKRIAQSRQAEHTRALAELREALDKARALLMRVAGAPTVSDVPWAEVETWAAAQSPASPPIPRDEVQK